MADSSISYPPGGAGGGMSIGGAVASGTPQSVLFVDASGNLAQDNANLQWDYTNLRLNINSHTFMKGGIDVGDTAFYDSTVAMSIKSGRTWIFNMYGNTTNPLMFLNQNGHLSIKTINSGTKAILTVNDPNTIDNLATAHISIGATGDKGLIVQGFSTGNIQEWQNSSGSLLARVDSAGNLSGNNLSGTNTGDQTSVSGNAGTATALATPRAIYGNNFDGSAALTQIIASTYGGTGNGFAKLSGPASTEKTFTLPNASATILTDNTVVTPAQGGTGVANSKNLTVSNSLTLAGTDSTTMTFPSTSATIARTDAANSFTGTQSATSFNETNVAVTVTSNAGTCAVTNGLNTFTNSSAATMAITIATASAVDGQLMIVRIYDFSAAAQTIGWTNTENSTVSAPLTSNGSTTLPLTVGFMFNSQTTKWRTLAVA